MNNLESYFSYNNVLKQLIRKRIAYASIKHNHEFVDKIAKDNRVKTKKKAACAYIEQEEKLIREMFPPRKVWIRCGNNNKKCRSKNSRAGYKYNTTYISQNELFFTVKKQKETLGPDTTTPNWLITLESQIQQIQSAIKTDNYDISKPECLIYKPKHKGSKSYRAIAKYSLTDSIVITLTTKYLTDHCDTAISNPYFKNCSYAFRSSLLRRKKEELNHHKAVERVLEYRKRYGTQTLYASEVDLKKFFDTVNHKTLLHHYTKLEEYFKNKSKPLDDIAIRLTKSYLNSYDFYRDTLPNEVKRKLEFGWPRAELENYGLNVAVDKIGVPQGGALSGFLANLLLHELDTLLLDKNDDELFYARFCDDFILIHPSEQQCKDYAIMASKKLQELKLVPHTFDDFRVDDYKFDKTKKEGGSRFVNSFWNHTKSKLGYKWGKYEANDAMKSNVPWLSFVGYQIRYDGVVRVRKKSLKNERAKQDKLVNKIINRVKKSDDDSVKLSISKVVFRTERKMVSMSVGKLKPKEAIWHGGFCWVNGFVVLKQDKRLNAQLKFLDRARERNLNRLKRALVSAKAKFITYQPGSSPRKPKKNILSKNDFINSYFHGFNGRKRE